MTQQTTDHIQELLNEVTEAIEDKDMNSEEFLKKWVDDIKRFNFILSIMTYGKVITDIKEMEAEHKREAEIFKKILLEELGKTDPKLREKIVRRIHRITVKALEKAGEEDNG